MFHISRLCLIFKIIYTTSAAVNIYIYITTTPTTHKTSHHHHKYTHKHRQVTTSIARNEREEEGAWNVRARIEEGASPERI